MLNFSNCQNWQKRHEIQNVDLTSEMKVGIELVDIKTTRPVCNRLQDQWNRNTMWFCKYGGDLNSELLRYSDHGDMFAHRMVCNSDAGYHGSSVLGSFQ